MPQSGFAWHVGHVMQVFSHVGATPSHVAPVPSYVQIVSQVDPQQV
jgi:hypothetical protein